MPSLVSGLFRTNVRYPNKSMCREQLVAMDPKSTVQSVAQPSPRHRGGAARAPARRRCELLEAPIGCPRAIALLLTLTLSSLMSSIRIELIATGAEGLVDLPRGRRRWATCPIFSSAAFRRPVSSPDRESRRRRCRKRGLQRSPRGRLTAPTRAPRRQPTAPGFRRWGRPQGHFRAYGSRRRRRSPAAWRASRPSVGSNRLVGLDRPPPDLRDFTVTPTISSARLPGILCAGEPARASSTGDLELAADLQASSFCLSVKGLVTPTTGSPIPSLTSR